ncbi:MAG: DNA recombination protein RmuC [bacterium]|nr:DNA recombination protein RmuC [bacterium]
MQPDLLIILSVIVIGLLLLYIVISRKLNEIGGKGSSTELIEWIKTTHTRLEEQNKSFTQTLYGVQRSFGEMNEIGRSMKDLQDLLKNPKLRGQIGEQVLKELLSQMLPKQVFTLQHAFKSGAIVDAAITTSAGIIPIDSKFPMENFRKMNSSTADEKEKKEAGREFVRDVMRHIDDISKKYILTDEGTIDYALMYIPSEAIYYEIVAGDPKLLEYSHNRRVLPVSPTTFYAFLRAILMSFEGQKIEVQAKELLASLRAIQKDYEKVDSYLSILTRHVGNASNVLVSLTSEFSRLGNKISSTRRISPQKETPEELVS